jgi:alginate O-acetyltransferase complex protein AlgI
LWHGAAWKFIAWGALHGGGLAVERMLEPWLGRRSQRPAARLVAVVIVFHFVCLAWVFFRAEDFAVARLYLAGFGAGWSGGLRQAGPFMVVLIAIGMAGQFIPGMLFERASAALARMPVWGLGAAAGIVVAMINALGPEGVAPFIYFRF